MGFGLFTCVFACDVLSNRLVNWLRAFLVVGKTPFLILVTDVDECAERLDSCIHGMEMCINDLGRYHCEPLSADAASPSSGQRHHDVDDHHHTPGFSQCPPGYTYDEDEQVCIGQQIK